MSFRKIATCFLPSILLIISSLKMKVNFVVRRTKKKVDGTVPIEMTISVKGKRRYVSTGREVKFGDFSSKTQTVRGDKNLNEFLKALKTRLYSIETILLAKGVNVSVETVLDLFRHGEQEHTMTFLQLFETHNENVRKRVKQKMIGANTLSKYYRSYLVLSAPNGIEVSHCSESVRNRLMLYSNSSKSMN